MAAYDDLDDRRIYFVGILSVVVLAVTALAVQVLYYWMLQNAEIATAAKSQYNRENAVLEAQDSEIQNFGVDSDTGSITIPIEDAIDQMVKKQGSSDDSGDKASDT